MLDDTGRAVDLWQKEVVGYDSSGAKKTVHWNRREKKAVVQTTFDFQPYKDTASSMAAINHRPVSRLGKHIAHVPFALIDDWNHRYRDRIQGECITDGRNRELFKQLLDRPEHKFLRTDR